MGTPDFSVPVLQNLVKTGHDVCAVYSQPPRKSGRGMKLTPSPVQHWAEKNKIDVFTPTSLRDETEQQRFSALKADAAVVVAYGMLLPQEILDTPKYGCFNIHASLLPRWRGAAPLQRAIMAGDKKTGVTIMQMEAGLDTGPMCLVEEIDITETTTTAALHDQLSALGARLMLKTLEELEAGTLIKTPQPDEGVTYAKKITKAEARINFNQPAQKVLAHIHGLSPFPGGWFELPVDGKLQRVKILTAKQTDKQGPAGQILDEQMTIACSTGAVRPTRLQRQGKGALDLVEFLRGIPVTPGAQV
jgi:methionyl-tRNA formyltransferase